MGLSDGFHLSSSDGLLSPSVSVSRGNSELSIHDGLGHGSWAKFQDEAGRIFWAWNPDANASDVGAHRVTVGSAEVSGNKQRVSSNGPPMKLKLKSIIVGRIAPMQNSEEGSCDSEGGRASPRFRQLEEGSSSVFRSATLGHSPIRRYSPPPFQSAEEVISPVHVKSRNGEREIRIQARESPGTSRGDREESSMAREVVGNVAVLFNDSPGCLKANSFGIIVKNSKEKGCLKVVITEAGRVVTEEGRAMGSGPSRSEL
ncbi:hypothetical protein QJS10_CPA01g01737 [Acorus calamus]|uniref:Uncharacterized protein n=1 Tax=Acorus calamus TaxID=4465 RepID=A0AAV9FM59_ACOCL|nr:hypothetical protein QJS10_CPA01g01737 [Acorus calamus]